jgi:hypothetical protein
METGDYKPLPDFPKECVGMICAAKIPSRSPCQSTNLFKNGRCRLHGGLSTGPKTLEGKKRSALNTGKAYEELIKAKKTTDKAPTEEGVKKANTLVDLTEKLSDKIKIMDDRYKDIPTPVNFAKLETDVKHHDRIIYGLLIVAVFASIGGYLHFDNKVSGVNNIINEQFKNLEQAHRQLEEKISIEAKSINKRIDRIVDRHNQFGNRSGED